MSKKMTVLTENDRQALLAKTPYALPDNPSSKNFSASQIKAKMYEAYLVLFEWLQKAITENNLNVDLSDASFTAINNAITVLQGYFTSGKANKAIADEDNRNIKSTYETKSDATSSHNTLNGLISNIISGITTVKKAEQDQSGNNIKASYASDINLNVTKGTSANTFVIQLVNKNGEVIGNTRTLQLQSASNAEAGLLTPTDKAKVDAIATDIATALASAKAYTDEKVARSNLVSILGEASTALNGLMSATDKARLDTIFASFNDDDQDTIVNKLKEVLAVFNNYPEGTTIVGALALKCSISDIVDNLTSNDAEKPLSAKQGKVLNDAVALKVAVADIVDNLITNATNKPLSANQGKVLNENKVGWQNLDIIANVVIGLVQGQTYYKLAQSVEITTTPKVVATTSALPATNDGNLYLVLADGYLYVWQTNAWARGLQYTTSIISQEDVVLEEDY